MRANVSAPGVGDRGVGGVRCCARFRSAARAELVGEFNARLTDVKRSYGAYTVVADARAYETSGAPPPILTHATVHFPRGASLRSAFLRDEFYCDRVRLMRYPPDPARCRSSHFASGTIVLDARPHIDTPFSADIHLFLAQGGAGRAGVRGRAGDPQRVHAGLRVPGAGGPARGRVGHRRAASATASSCRPT